MYRWIDLTGRVEYLRLTEGSNHHVPCVCAVKPGANSVFPSEFRAILEIWRGQLLVCTIPLQTANVETFMVLSPQAV